MISHSSFRATKIITGGAFLSVRPLILIIMIQNRIAILGATSQLARDLILSCAGKGWKNLFLIARRPDSVREWLGRNGLADLYPVEDFAALNRHDFYAIINFVGIGDPAQAAILGAKIFELTLQYDDLALSYLRQHPNCRYLFLSSGAAYGTVFREPVNEKTPAVVNLNSLCPQDWYGVAKLHAECRHRSFAEFSIFDIRVFNYFSRTQDIGARFFMTDIVRHICEKVVLKTSQEYIVRDYLHPSDFFRLISALLTTPPANSVVDCYSKAPVDKPSLLANMQEHFGLQYEISDYPIGVNATGDKRHYYSTNIRAAKFGYFPMKTSLEGLVEEVTYILNSQLCG